VTVISLISTLPLASPPQVVLIINQDMKLGHHHMLRNWLFSSTLEGLVFWEKKYENVFSPENGRIKKLMLLKSFPMNGNASGFRQSYIFWAISVSRPWW
jgi:hypothetical protein